MSAKQQHQARTRILGVAVTPTDRKRIDAARGREPLSSWLYRLIRRELIRDEK